MKTTTKRKFKNALLSVFVLASLVGCGSDSGGGNNGYNFNGNYVGNSNGGAYNVQTAQQLADAIKNNRFDRSSVPGNYIFSKNSNFSGSSPDCDEKLGGLITICTSSSSSSSYYSNSDVGFRQLLASGEIRRDVLVYNNSYNFPEDEFFGNSLSSLASYLSAKVLEARTNGGLYKLISNGYGGYITCQYSEYNYGNNNNNYYYNDPCQSAYQTSTKYWGLIISGKQYVIDLSRSLIEQPVMRQY